MNVNVAHRADAARWYAYGREDERGSTIDVEAFVVMVTREAVAYFETDSAWRLESIRAQWERFTGVTVS